MAWRCPSLTLLQFGSPRGTRTRALSGRHLELGLQRLACELKTLAHRNELSRYTGAGPRRTTLDYRRSAPSPIRGHGGGGEARLQIKRPRRFRRGLRDPKRSGRLEVALDAEAS